MDYHKVLELVKEEILSHNIPRNNWIWDYIGNYDMFLWQIEHDSNCKNYQTEEDLADYIVEQLMYNYHWSEFEQAFGAR